MTKDKKTWPRCVIYTYICQSTRHLGEKRVCFVRKDLSNLTRVNLRVSSRGKVLMTKDQEKQIHRVKKQEKKKKKKRKKGWVSF